MNRLFRSAFGCLAAAVLATPAMAAPAEPDMAKLDEVRSLVAEAASLEYAQAAGRVTGPYAATLREALIGDLHKSASDPTLGWAARDALAALARHDASALVRTRDQLVKLERAHGRAS